MTKPKNTAAKDVDYQALTNELQALMSKLEQGELDIDEAVDSYQRGLLIVEQLESRLIRAENVVTELRQSHTEKAA